ncbi:MAG: dolichyl-diphosphooligosaccharide--protein glycosyltransferase subunit STT3 [Methanobacteriaceae archaeon]|nr:dolichyl-diphosphooligosaccharide--protein glycosyltransferase subunit STT3 [Methanobacteriaceae archaeon]
MSAREVLSKYKPLIIIILLFVLVFSLRAEAANLSNVPDQMKSFYQDDNGLPYFSEMDSYFNYRMTQDYLDHGYIGDTKINGTNWDLHSYYPPGRAAEYPPLIVYLTAYTYKFVNIFGEVPLAEVAFWLTAFIASLVVIPAYLFIRGITNDYGGITAAILIGLAPAYFSHTFAGFFDTDMFNMLLPLLVVWFFIESIRADNIRNRSLFAVLSAFSMLIFALAWQGWTYLFVLVIVTLLIYLAVTYLFHLKRPQTGDYSSKKEWFLNHPEIFTLTVFVVLSSLLMLIFMGVSGFVGAFSGLIGATELQSTVQATSYPNVFVSVAELQIPSLLEVISNVGGYVAFVFGFLGVFLLFWRLRVKKKEETEDTSEKSQNKKLRRKKRYKTKRKKVKAEEEKSSEPKYVIPELTDKEKRNYLLYGILLLFWLLITAYALTKGVRFVQAFALPIGLSAGIFVGLILEYVKKYVQTPNYRTVLMIVLVVAVAFTPIYNAYAISSGVVPGTDDSMVNSLNWIKQNTPQNTVITSWWDYGHLFAVEADRPVTFDGGTQNSPRAYWVGKSLSTNNESLSVGIIRMLTTSGDLGPLTLENYTKNTGKSVEILNGVLGVDKETARTIMTTQYSLTTEQAQNVLQYTHPDNPAPFMFITSSDMLGKAGWWSYFGNWNFKTNNSTSYNYLSAQAVVVPKNETGLSNNITVLIGNNAVYAEIIDNNVSAGIINVNQLQNKNITASQLITQLSSELQGGNGTLLIKPHKLIVMADGNITQDQVVSNESQFSIVFIKEGDTFMTVVMNRELEDAMFTRLYLLKGQGLAQFRLAYQQPGVMVWTV